MKVLLIANYLKDGGGISVQVALLRDLLRSEGYICDILSTKGSIINRFLTPFVLFFKGKKYDVFHIHACSNKGFLPAVIGISIGRLIGRRIVLTYHGGGADQFFRKRSKIVKHFLTKTDQNIVLSGFVGAIFDRYNLRYTIVPNILETGPQSLATKSQIQPKYISIRSFTDTYNIICTIKAFKIVQGVFPEAELCLLGNGPLKEELEGFVEGENISRVSFLGHIDNHHIYDFLYKADIMVSSARFDNMPVSILEGFNAGLLVIASRVGGVPYMIEDGYNGLLFEDDNEKDMAEKMIYAVLHQNEAFSMIKNAYYSLDRYRWKTVKNRIVSIYKGAQNDEQI